MENPLFIEVINQLIEKYPEEKKYKKYLNLLPKGVEVDGDYLVKNGRKKKEIKLTRPLEEIEEFLDLVADKKKADIDLKSWKSVKKRKETKEAALINFCTKIKDDMNLTYKQYEKLLALIHIGLFIKVIENEDVIMKGIKIKEIKKIDIVNGEPQLDLF